MNDEITQKKTKLLYTIGEVAEMFDVNVSLIRHWSNYFDILKPTTNKKGNRLYSPQDIENIKMIYNLVKERGIHLKEAQAFLKKNRTKVENNVVVLEKLMNIKAMLTEVLLNLDDQTNSDDTYYNTKWK